MEPHNGARTQVGARPEETRRLLALLRDRLDEAERAGEAVLKVGRGH